MRGVRIALAVFSLNLLALGSLVVVVRPLFAHHSVSMYDMQNPTTVVGAVERVEWTNPHAYIYVKATGVSGGAGQTGVGEEWAIEVDSPNFLKHNGWTSTTVKPGDMITCKGGRAKDGARSMRCTTVTLSNGQELRS